MPDLHATIVPGRTAAGIVVGTPVSELDLAGASFAQLQDGISVCHLGPVRVWIRNGVVDQVGVQGAYSGSIERSGIRIGNTLRDVVEALGPIFEDDEDNLVVRGVPGICFETEQWRGEPGGETVDQNLDARITEIVVFSP